MRSRMVRLRTMEKRRIALQSIDLPHEIKCHGMRVRKKVRGLGRHIASTILWFVVHATLPGRSRDRRFIFEYVWQVNDSRPCIAYT